MSPAKAVARSTEAPERVIRDPEFARRLDSACDASGLCPPLHKGRLTWVQHELKRHFKEEVSVETVRKWFTPWRHGRGQGSAVEAQQGRVVRAKALG